LLNRPVGTSRLPRKAAASARTLRNNNEPTIYSARPRVYLRKGRVYVKIIIRLRGDDTSMNANL